MSSAQSGNIDVVTSNHKPDTVFHWSDKETDAVGWVVLDRIINGVSGGGIFMHANATLQEVADIARNMTRKFTVTDPQIGGAKAGIRYDHTRADAKDVLRRFIIANEVLLRNVWVTAGDLNTDDAFIEKVIQEDVKLDTCQHFLGASLAKHFGRKSLNDQLKQLISMPVNLFFPLIEGAVGYGIAASLLEAHRLATGKSAPTGTHPLRVAIQGFGAVGSSLAYFLSQHEHVDIIGIADKDGFVVSRKQSLPIESFLAHRSQMCGHVKNDPSFSQHSLDIHRKNLMCNFPADFDDEDVERSLRLPSENDDAFLKRFLSAVGPVEAVSLCAGRYALTPSVVETLLEKCWPSAKNDDTLSTVCCKIMANGANNSFGEYHPETGKLQEAAPGSIHSLLLDKNGVVVVPDWVANSGTAQLFHRGLSVDFGSPNDLVRDDVPNATSTIAKGFVYRVLESCAEPIRAYIGEAFRTSCHGNPVRLSAACSKLANEFIKAPRTFDQTLKRLKYRYAIPMKPEEFAALPSIDRSLAICDLITASGEEFIGRDEMKALLERHRSSANGDVEMVAYDGFEPSGRMHIAQGILKAINVNRLTSIGMTYIMWIADYFAMLNNKMGGDLDVIRKVGQYFIEVWKACGINVDRTKFLWTSEEIDARPDAYWGGVLNVSMATTVNRVKRCVDIMGRSDAKFDEGPSSRIVYPLMQATDIGFLDVDVCQLGMDQRKVNMLAREVYNGENHKKPIILSHRMIAGLRKTDAKMSKSHPDSAIFMEDTIEDVERKIKGAFCPPFGESDPATLKVLPNPVLEYFEFIVFPALTELKPKSLKGVTSVEIVLSSSESSSSSSTAVPVIVKNFDELKTLYADGKLSPQQLKATLARYLNILIEPVRVHFSTNPNANALAQFVKTLSVTR